jgi:hypothetical protein
MSIFWFKVKDARGQEKSLSDYRGIALLVVNTASKCGYTPQYAGLQELYANLKDKGLEILAFPCDQFGHQEPGTDDEIQQFCQLNYGVTFPVFCQDRGEWAGCAPAIPVSHGAESRAEGQRDCLEFYKISGGPPRKRGRALRAGGQAGGIDAGDPEGIGVNM